ncbi:TlpA family protein disulfide reductase [Salipaludibacillus daqingensis]
MLLTTLPNIELQRLDGGTFSTDELQGKKTLIFMWASW